MFASRISITNSRFEFDLQARKTLTKTTKRYVTDATVKKKSPVPFSPVYAALPTPLNADGSLASADIAHNIQKYAFPFATMGLHLSPFLDSAFFFRWAVEWSFFSVGLIHVPFFPFWSLPLPSLPTFMMRIFANNSYVLAIQVE